VTFKEQYFWVKDSNLYTKSLRPIPLYIAGLRPLTAKLAGEEGDGFVINELNVESIKNKLLPTVKEGTKRSGKDYDSLEKILFIPASYDENKDKALQSIRFWRGAMIKAFFEVEIDDPRIIEENGKVIEDDTLEEMLLVISNGDEGIKKLKKYADLGFTEIVLTNSRANREKLLNLIAEKIAPEFKNVNR
jgi:coenzyme F420-dependent glucose-6-phosphate dehydrogenase